MKDKFEVVFPTAKRAAMALAKLFEADFMDTQVGVSGTSLLCLNRDVLRSVIEILSPPGISDDEPTLTGEPPSAFGPGAALVNLAHLKVEEAIAALGDAEAAYLSDGFGGRAIMARNAWRHLESYQSQVLEFKLNAKAGR